MQFAISPAEKSPLTSISALADMMGILGNNKTCDPGHCLAPW
jgi:hypothetical protein